MAQATGGGGLTMDEYINRDAYIRYLSSRKSEFVDDYGKGWSAGINTAIRACEKFPAADVAPVRHGRWIKPTKIDGRFFSIPHCSVCESVPCGVDENTKFCPNCGAKMGVSE
ncbi:MAG: hypothetical protein ACI4DY_13415 [Monoglobaceae bacterium]